MAIIHHDDTTRHDETRRSKIVVTKSLRRVSSCRRGYNCQEHSSTELILRKLCGVMRGRLVHSTRMPELGNHAVVQTSAFPAGMYFFALREGSFSVARQKLLIQH